MIGDPSGATAAPPHERADYDLLLDSGVTLFHKRSRLSRTCRNLEKLGYELLHVDCTAGREIFCRQMSRALRWKQQLSSVSWQGSLDELNDAFADFPPASIAQSAFVLEGFEQISDDEPEFARGVLETIAHWSHRTLVRGCRILALVQSNRSDLDFKPVDPRVVTWNGWDRAARWRTDAALPPSASEARHEALTRLVQRAFPYTLTDQAREAAEQLVPLILGAVAHHAIGLEIDSTRQSIPVRLSLAAIPSRHPGLGDTSWLMVLCLLSRDRDGHQREAALRAIVERDEPWVAPFVLLAAADPVVEVASVAWKAAPTLHRSLYADLVRANRTVVRELRRTADCHRRRYYGASHQDRESYPGLAFLRTLETWAA